MVDASGPKLGLRVTKRLLERLIGGRPVSGRADRGAERAAATQLEGRQDGGASGLPVSGGGESTSSGTGDGHIDVIGGERGSYTNSEDIKRALAQSRHIGKLLLKNETDELDRVRAAAEDAVSQQFEEIRRFSHTREPPEGRQGAESLCEGERAACVACLGDTKDALKCSESIRAYVNCANELMQH